MMDKKNHFKESVSVQPSGINNQIRVRKITAVVNGVKGKGMAMIFGALILEDWGTIIDESVIPPQVDHRLLKKGELIEL